MGTYDYEERINYNDKRRTNMSKVQFRKATKEQAKLRLALFGPSGAGKTFSALRIATGMGGNIAVIDTERGSASKYADRFEFDVLELDTRNITTYCAAIQAANDAGYNVLIIDSLTHAWKELLEQINKIAKTKYGGNTWAAWSDGTPRQNKLVDTILNCNCHIIATMRSKTEWAVNQDKGKTRPVRIGLAPEQGKGIEYEFDMLMEISAEHNAVVIKDRTGKYQDRMIELPDEEFGQSLADWLQDGTQPTQKKTQPKQQPGKPEQKSSTPERPYPPDTCIRGLRLKAKWNCDSGSWSHPPRDLDQPTDKQIQRAAALLESALKNGDTAETTDRRYAVTRRIFLVESLKDCSAAEVDALLKWAESEPGSWEINEYVEEEALAILNMMEDDNECR